MASPDTSFLISAVFRDPASISFGERTPEGIGFKVLAVSRRSGLLPPGVVQIATVHRVKTEIVNEAKHCGLGIRRIAGIARMTISPAWTASATEMGATPILVANVVKLSGPREFAIET